jgi:hypothetical protein
MPSSPCLPGQGNEFRLAVEDGFFRADHIDVDRVHLALPEVRCLKIIKGTTAAP